IPSPTHVCLTRWPTQPSSPTGTTCAQDHVLPLPVPTVECSPLYRAQLPTVSSTSSGEPTTTIPTLLSALRYACTRHHSPMAASTSSTAQSPTVDRVPQWEYRRTQAHCCSPNTSATPVVSPWG